MYLMTETKDSTALGVSSPFSVSEYRGIEYTTEVRNVQATGEHIGLASIRLKGKPPLELYRDLADRTTTITVDKAELTESWRVQLKVKAATKAELCSAVEALIDKFRDAAWTAPALEKPKTTRDWCEWGCPESPGKEADVGDTVTYFIETKKGCLEYDILIPAELCKDAALDRTLRKQFTQIQAKYSGFVTVRWEISRGLKEYPLKFNEYERLKYNRIRMLLAHYLLDLPGDDFMKLTKD